MAENGVVSAGPSALTEPGGAGAGVAMAGGLPRVVGAARDRRRRLVAREQHDGDRGQHQCEDGAAHQSANRSTKTWRRGTPVRPRIARVASVMAGGPHTKTSRSAMSGTSSSSRSGESGSLADARSAGRRRARAPARRARRAGSRPPRAPPGRPRRRRPGRSSSSARIGVMPTPPAISATRRDRRAVKPPNGPSRITRVPGRMSRSEARVVAQPLHRDPQPPPVRRRRERERMRLPPVTAGQEAPGEEVARRAPAAVPAARRRSPATPRPASRRPRGRLAAGAMRCAPAAARAGTRPASRASRRRARTSTPARRAARRTSLPVASWWLKANATPR